jgi:hypothetical protein
MARWEDRAAPTRVAGNRTSSEEEMTSTAAPVGSAHVAPVRPRRTVWPYAGIVSALAAGAAGRIMAQGPGTFRGDGGQPTTDFVLANLTPELTVKLGAGLYLLGVAAAFVFLLGLTRHVAVHAPRSAEPLRWASIALLATGSLGAAIRYIAAGGIPGAMDSPMYTPEASATIAVLADQLSTAAFLPALAVMAVVGLAAVRDRVLPVGVGIVTLLLAAASFVATLVLGLPYSSSLVCPLFALTVGVAGLLSRRSA